MAGGLQRGDSSRELFRDWVSSRQVEVCRVAEKEGFHVVEDEYHLLEKWKAQKPIPRRILEFLKAHLPKHLSPIRKVETQEL